MEKDCVFCKIVKREIPCSLVYEDSDVMAFLDIDPETIGHTLVIPKEHHDNFLTSPKNVMHKVMDVAQRIGQVHMKKLGALGVNIVINNYPAAGQSVLHLHVHVLPRYGKDNKILIMKDKLEGELYTPSVIDLIKSGL